MAEKLMTCTTSHEIMRVNRKGCALQERDEARKECGCARRKKGKEAEKAVRYKRGMRLEKSVRVRVAREARSQKIVHYNMR